MADLDQFREETRSWLEANCPPEMRQPVEDEADVYWGGRNATFKNEAQKAWFEACVAKGYTVPAWPKEYGGAGLSPAEAKVLREEMARIDARSPLHSFGIWMLGPALLHFGTEGQKQRFLNEIARGEIRWCQGYSEPGSGSDLVSMQTFGEDKGDHWVVNGQKIWTSYADEADWIFCLVRTDKENKYQGITFMLFDMENEGVSTKPIKLISGNSPFCETFMDDVTVPKSYGEDIPGYVGEIMQVPPAFSAVKVDGARAYDLAREGEDPDLAARPLWVESLSLIEADGDTARLEMVCGKGGYVRSIARDLGRDLGCLGHVASLRRTWSGPFEVEDGMSFDGIDREAQDRIQARLLPLEAALTDLPALRATPEGAIRIRNGNPGEVTGGAEWGELVWVADARGPVCIGRYQGGTVQPERVFNL